MFVRRHGPDSDAAAIARRRLAALATQFETVPDSGADAAASSSDTDTALSDSGAARSVPARAPAGASTGEHVADDAMSSLVGDPMPTSPGRHAGRRLTDESVRWSLTVHQVTVVALVVAAVVAVAAWLVLRSVPDAAPVQLSTERSLPVTDSIAPPSSSQPPMSAASGGAIVTPAGEGTAPPLIVDVVGKVRRPGIVELPAGARVVDAIRAAGGARAGVDTTSLNLARVLVDGEQIVVGLKVPAVDLAPSPAVSGSSTTSAIASVDLNSATQEQLETLPGIGPVTAAAILAWRDEHGAFTSVDELLEVSGIGEVTLSEIEAYVHV